MREEPRPQLGCTILGGGRAEFLVWAPRAEKVELHIVEPEERRIEMRPAGRGYHHLETGGVAPGCLYFFRPDGRADRPDPASRLQPLGVHGPSAAVDPNFEWSDAGWQGLPLENFLLYEIHVGAFTPQGTLDALPEVALPDGVEFRPAREEDLRTIWRANVEAFRDHWGGFAADDATFEEWLADPKFDPSLWVVAWDGDEIAGASVNTISEHENAGQA